METPKNPHPSGSPCNPYHIDREDKYLSPFAAKSRDAQRLYTEADGNGFRMAFQEDFYRIVRSRSFRRLAHKTQALSALTGDHRRTRLTHTLEVSLIAKTLSRVFALNEDLTDAIAMGHDLGHTPFGHAGERALNLLVPGGFSHKEQSLRVVDVLADNGNGLNLTIQTRDGIVKHSKGLGPVFPENKESSPITLEGLIVRVSDIVAYLAHDLDDALYTSIIRLEDIPIRILKVFGETGNSSEDAMLKDILENSRVNNNDKGSLSLSFSKEMEEHMDFLRDFLFKKVYRNEGLMRLMERGANIVTGIYRALMTDDSLYEKLPLAHLADSRPEAARDFIAGMTDRFAINYAKENLGLDY